MTELPGRVSTVIPLFNHQKYITRAVESVLAQGPMLKELIVIDDGSTDESAAVMDGLSSRDGRITFLRQENRGAHVAINRGLELASGEYITILNSDDFFAEGRFAALARCLDIDEGSDFVSSSISFVDGGGASIENPWFKTALEGFKARRDVAVSLMDANYMMTTSNFFVRRSLLKRIGSFAPLRYAHDLEFALRCAANGIRFCFIDRPLLSYRFHDSNTISENHSRVRLEWALCMAMYMRLKYPDGGDHEDKARIAEIRAIIDRHSLTRAVDLMLAFLNKHGIDAIDDDFVTRIMPTHTFLAAV